MNNLAQRRMSREELRSRMRRLWLDHIYWTRLFIVSSLAKLPDAPTAADRLIRNQREIGDLVGAFYKGAGDRLTQLLTRHITIAAEFVSSFNSVNGAGGRRTSDEIRRDWYRNADEITAYLHSLNQNWALREHLYAHLRLTEAELQKRMQKDHAAEVAYVDDLANQSASIADALSEGIVRQFPMAFDGQPPMGGQRFNNANARQNFSGNGGRRR